MNKKQLHEQSLKELRKLEYIFEDSVDKSTFFNAKNARTHLQSLGYKVKPTLDEVGDITPEFSSILQKISSAFKKEMPDLKIQFGSGRDDFHRRISGTSRHNKGNANDVVFGENTPGDIKETDNEILDKISTLLCAARKSIPGFTFIDEYRHGTKNSTGNHFHLSWSENGRDESRFTPKFCSSVNVSSLDSFEFPEIPNNEITNKQEPSKLDKFLDYVGLGDLSDATAGNKESQKTLVDKAKELFTDDDIKDNDDGFEIFGYKLDDILDNVKSILPQFESYEYKNKKKLNEEVINELKKIEHIFEKNSTVLDKFSGDIENGPKYHGSRPLGNWQSDNAWDLFAPAGTQWNSITKGIVKKIHDTGRNTGKIYGTQVSINGTDGYPDIFYTHLKDVTLQKGDVVDIGTPVGKVSEWGESKSTHVHVGLPKGKRIEDLLSPDLSDPEGTSSTFEVKKVEKEPSKLEKFLDYVGLGSLVDAKPGDKESQKELVSKVENKKDVKDTNDGFEIFGYSVDDILDKIGDLLPQFESEQKKKNILEDIERIKSKMIK
jgi:soluble cytochrome b562